jgi:iron complex outermembrane recepter protein
MRNPGRNQKPPIPWPRHSVGAGLGVALIVLSAFLAGPSRADENQADLANQSLENLMNMQVTSVSKTEQKLSQTAAAVFVITQEDIARSGATNIPDLLRMVPGMDVAQINGSTWAISSRGFNQQFSNKLMVMVDGRPVYTSTFAGVFWDVMDLPLEDIERIEVIRGPGGAIWGANAVDGVINIIMKKAGETKGGVVTAGAGNVEQGFGMMQYGGSLGNETDFRVYTKYFDQNHLLGLTGQNGADGWHALRGGFRVDSALNAKDSLMIEGDLTSQREGEYGFVLPSVTSPGLVPVAEEVDSSNGAVDAVWTHEISARSETQTQFSYDRHVRDDPQNPEIRGIFDLQFQHHVMWGSRQNIVYRRPDRDDGSDAEGPTGLQLVRSGRDCAAARPAIPDGRLEARAQRLQRIRVHARHTRRLAAGQAPNDVGRGLAGVTRPVAERHEPGAQLRVARGQSADLIAAAGQPRLPR